ncbi:efflux RND transporter permease subunit [Immundisolibacter cernigliae]|uniref:Acriflavin resistance protein n=1 Tax=Immundisolibacter cernigliae TaxID=1810504 RepID=A0A1B1YRY4_9GAMM|nr:efflux RND transporter permease subunit [Immundisolibacter cernigliae]ANX03544.1 acriflavin resistance protein [Immundisolibacter cernigliae]
MSLPELSINRHVLAYMLSGVIVLFGIVAYRALGVDRFPHIDFPIVSVTTTQPGANPEVIDASITNIIERQVNSVPGIDYIQSSSTPGVSQVTITFKLEKDIDVAFQEVQSKVSQVVADLPDDADPPVVAKVEADATPILWLHILGDRTLQQLNTFVTNTLRRQIETIDGVGDIRIGGLRPRNIRVEVHPERLSAHGLTVQDVLDAFRNEHLLLPGGFVTSRTQERLLKLDIEYHSPRELQNMVIGYEDGAEIRLSQVAEVIDGMADYRRLARRDGQSVVGMGIVKVTGANTVAIVDEVQQRLKTEIIPQLPAGIEIRQGTDNSIFIVEMVDALKEHLISGTLLAGAVVLLFLRSFRATLIIAAAIPVSLLGAIAVMYFLDYTFNSMTLLALLLLVGVVVDDAIVVLENIHRHREHIDPDPRSAAIEGTKQVMFAVLAATLSLVAIFVPVVFMGGMIGRFFSSFSVVVVFGVLVSWFVSLTLTPMLCSRYLDVSHSHGRLYGAFGRFFEAMDRFYRRVLNAGLRWRWGVVAATLVVVASSGWFFGAIGKEFVPVEDESRFMVIFKTPLGSSVEYTNSRLQMIEQVLEADPTVLYTFGAIGLFTTAQANEGMVFVTITPRDERAISQHEVIARLRPQLGSLPGVRAFAVPTPAIGGQRGETLQFAVRGPNLTRVGEYAVQMRERLMQMPGFGFIDLDLLLDMPQLRLEIDRTRTAALGLSSRDVAMAANVLAGGMDIAKWNDDPGDGERYDVRLKAPDGTFETPDDLRKIFLRAGNGELVRLDTVARFVEKPGPARIDRFDLQYAARFYNNPEMPLNVAVEKVQGVAAEVLPLGYSIKLLGSAREFSQTMGFVATAFVLALVMLYMVLASQFDSFLQPLIIMVAQPLAMVGGLAALWLAGHTLNIYSMIGLVLLVGLVAKNSILLVDLTNQLRDEGKSIGEALREACPVRLRPVLMTSLTVILAMLPAAFGVGAGSDTNGPLAVAVIGGMVSSTLLTLVVVPVVYSLVEHGVLRLRARRAARRPASA